MNVAHSKTSARQQINKFVAMAVSTSPPLLDLVNDRTLIEEMMGHADYQTLLNKKLSGKTSRSKSGPKGARR